MDLGKPCREFGVPFYTSQHEVNNRRSATMRLRFLSERMLHTSRDRSRQSEDFLDNPYCPSSWAKPWPLRCVSVLWSCSRVASSVRHQEILCTKGYVGYTTCVFQLQSKHLSWKQFLKATATLLLSTWCASYEPKSKYELSKSYEATHLLDVLLMIQGWIWKHSEVAARNQNSSC